MAQSLSVEEKEAGLPVVGLEILPLIRRREFPLIHQIQDEDMPCMCAPVLAQKVIVIGIFICLKSIGDWECGSQWGE